MRCLSPSVIMMPIHFEQVACKQSIRPVRNPMKTPHALFTLVLLVSARIAFANSDNVLSHTVTGDVFPYVVQSGDSLKILAARFGVPAELIARSNHLDRKAKLEAGTELWIYNLHIAPDWKQDGIVINLPQRMLFFFNDGWLETSFPVGLGKPSWPTPAGDFKVVNLQTDKEWIVPESIQEEMRVEGKPVITRVPPGPKNPLGRHWVGLSAWGYGIHGTNAPGSVYGFQSHGCIRALPDDIETLSKAAPVGTEVASIYQTTLMALTWDGHVFIEVHKDTYERGDDPLSAIETLAQQSRIANRINWPLVEDVIRRRDGLATDVTRLARRY